jgi:hypothetical protein
MSLEASFIYNLKAVVDSDVFASVIIALAAKKSYV